MEYLLLVASLISTAVLFLISLIFSISKNNQWLKFMAYGLLNLTLSCVVLLYLGRDFIPSRQVENLVIAAFVFIVFGGFFFLVYQLNKNKDDEKNV